MDEIIKKITIEDENYPKLLKEIKNPPKTLYYKGNLSVVNKKCFAVVGTRRPTDYGKQVAMQIAGDLADNGLVVVSGLAPGIDTFAHKVCVEKKLPTIAVLGTGLDDKTMYPQENLQLSKKIIEYGGCLISELPEKTPGAKFTFPNRNRIVSGLSLGVLVVEAKEKSGSLITADFARKQNKKLFAIPGQIFTQNAKGSNKLIKQGAILVTSVNDILNDLNLLSIKKDGQLFSESPLENQILNILKQEPLYIDEIIRKLKLSAQDVVIKLALMEISGKVRNLGSNVYGII